MLYNVKKLISGFLFGAFSDFCLVFCHDAGGFTHKQHVSAANAYKIAVEIAAVGIELRYDDTIASQSRV